MDSDLQLTEQKVSKRRGPSCLVVIALILLIPYLLNIAFVSIPGLANWLKWNRLGAEDYSIHLRNSSLSPFAGDTIIEVDRGSIVSVIRPGCDECEVGEFEAWSDYTVEGLFGSLGQCVVLFPIVSCSIGYDADLGHPSTLLVNCPIPDACYERITVVDVSLTE